MKAKIGKGTAFASFCHLILCKHCIKGKYTEYDCDYSGTYCKHSDLILRLRKETTQQSQAERQ